MFTLRYCLLYTCNCPTKCLWVKYCRHFSNVNKWTYYAITYSFHERAVRFLFFLTSGLCSMVLNMCLLNNCTGEKVRRVIVRSADWPMVCQLAALLIPCLWQEVITVWNKRQQNSFWFQSTQQYIILFYLDDNMFRSLDHLQAIFTKFRIR